MEAANTTIRLITRPAYGFHSADALIALVMLTLGGDCGTAARRKGHRLALLRGVSFAPLSTSETTRCS